MKILQERNSFDIPETDVPQQFQSNDKFKLLSARRDEYQNEKETIMDIYNYELIEPNYKLVPFRDIKTKFRYAPLDIYDIFDMPDTPRIIDDRRVEWSVAISDPTHITIIVTNEARW